MSKHHDLGGLDLGPVEVSTDDPAFHAEFEGIAWAISRSARAPEITIDWWRHCREVIAKEEYLNRPYFDSWMQTDMATYIDGGFFTVEELLTGNVNQSETPPKKTTTSDVMALDRAANRDFSAPTNQAARYKIGDRVTTLATPPAGHTRLPKYAAGKTGIIHAHHGGHHYPDAGAQGEDRGEHLYTVMFAATDLFGDSAGTQDKIYLDLWEPYFV